MTALNLYCRHPIQLHPRWDRNLNTGDRAYDSTPTAAARQAIYHNPEQPSRISLTSSTRGCLANNARQPLCAGLRLTTSSQATRSGIPPATAVLADGGRHPGAANTEICGARNWR